MAKPKEDPKKKPEQAKKPASSSKKASSRSKKSTSKASPPAGAVPPDVQAAIDAGIAQQLAAEPPSNIGRFIGEVDDPLRGFGAPFMPGAAPPPAQLGASVNAAPAPSPPPTIPIGSTPPPLPSPPPTVPINTPPSPSSLPPAKKITLPSPSGKASPKFMGVLRDDLADEGSAPFAPGKTPPGKGRAPASSSPVKKGGKVGAFLRGAAGKMIKHPGKTALGVGLAGLLGYSLMHGGDEPSAEPPSAQFEGDYVLREVQPDPAVEAGQSTGGSVAGSSVPNIAPPVGGDDMAMARWLRQEMQRDDPWVGISRAGAQGGKQGEQGQYYQQKLNEAFAKMGVDKGRNKNIYEMAFTRWPPA